jgi:hypothetical protein
MVWSVSKYSLAIALSAESSLFHHRTLSGLRIGEPLCDQEQLRHRFLCKGVRKGSKFTKTLNAGCIFNKRLQVPNQVNGDKLNSVRLMPAGISGIKIWNL